MGTWKYGVRFASGGKTKDGVPFFPWDTDTWGWVQFDNDAIRLEGKHRMGVAGEILTLGPLQTLVKNVVADSLEVAIPIADIESVTVDRNPRNKITHFGVRQRLDDGSTVQHAFTTGLIVKKKQPGSDEAIAEMLAVVPREIVEGILPAGYGAPTESPTASKSSGAPAVLPAASKSPGLHAVASFFIPGLGTLLCGKTARGLLILGLSAVSLFGVNILANALIGGEPTGIGTLLAIPLWVWGVVDGYRSARQWNLEHVGEAELPVEKAGQASADPLDVAPTQDSTAANEPDSGVTPVGLLRDFLVRNGDDVSLADIDAMREIANSGCSPAVVQRHRAFGHGIVQKFMDELADHGFISNTPQ